ncbi:hypothetical protein PS838_05599 [Pseudomonas fluorescens]|nr:hypothetical protein PS838_05599 [Pseudomonas fluorescens]
MKTGSNTWRHVGVGVWFIALVAALGWAMWGYGERVGLVENHHKLLAFLLIVAIGLVGIQAPRLLIHFKRQSHREQGLADNVYPQKDVHLVVPGRPVFDPAELHAHLHQDYGFFWRRKVRLLLVVGEPEQIQAIAPGLTRENWQEGQGTVLLWGGSLQGKPDQANLDQWRQLSRWRGLDGVVWALNKSQSAETALIGTGVRRLRELARTLGWQLPLHLWQVCDSEWAQAKRATQAVGCLLPARATAVDLETSLDQLILPLRESGWAQIFGDMKHDFLLRLSRDLQAEGIARWRQALAPWFGDFNRSVPLRGLWFSLPLTRAPSLLKHDWLADPVWQGVLGDPAASGHRLGWSPPRIAYVLLLSLAMVWGAGMLLSFATQRVQIAQVQTSLVALAQSQTGDAQLLALNDLMRELARLDYRAEHDAPWYQRFGLNQNQNLLEKIQPIYVDANQRLLRDPAVANLQAKLTALIKLPPRQCRTRAPRPGGLRPAQGLPDAGAPGKNRRGVPGQSPARSRTDPRRHSAGGVARPVTKPVAVLRRAPGGAPRVAHRGRPQAGRPGPASAARPTGPAQCRNQSLSTSVRGGGQPRPGLEPGANGRRHRGRRAVHHQGQRPRRVHPPGLGRPGASGHR